MPELTAEDAAIRERAKAYLLSDDSEASVNFGGLNPDFAGRAARMSTPILTREQAAKQFAVRNTADVPLDVQSGAPFMQRLAAAWRTQPDEILQYWINKYGRDRVRLADDQSVIVRMTDEKTGLPKDVLVDERNLSAKDLADLSGIVPEIAAGVAAVRVGRAIPKLGQAGGVFGRTRDILAEAAGSELGGGMKEMAMRPITGVPLQPGEILRRRAESVLPSAAFGGMATVFPKVGMKLITPLGESAPDFARAGKEGADYFRSTEGIDLRHTAGQRTGNPFLLRSESFLPKMPAASEPFEKGREQQIKAMSQIQNRVVGLPKDAMESDRRAIPGMEDLLERLKSVVRTKLEPLQQNIEQARSDLVSGANQEIWDRIEQATMPQRQLYNTVAGDAIRTKTQAMWDDFDAQVKQNYNAMRAWPGGGTRVLQTPNLSKDAQAYLDQRLPSGQVQNRGLTLNVILDKFVPSDVVSRLRQLADLGDGPFSLNDLIQMRRDVDNALAAVSAIPGQKDYHLKNIKKILTKSMNEAVDLMPTQDLKNAWKAAEQHYADNIGKFQTRSVGLLLRKPDEPGFVGEAELFNRVMGGIDRIDELKQFFGANSPEMKIIRRRVADDILERSMYKGQTVLNAKKLLDELAGLQANNREVFDEVFGNHGLRLLQQAQLMTVGQADKIDSAIIEQGIRNPTSIPPLRRLINAQKDLDRQYQNNIIKMIGTKSVPVDGLDPAEFVNRFVRSGTPEQTKQVMDLISDRPLLQFQIRARAMLDLFQEASRNPSPQDKLAMRLFEQNIVSPSKIEQMVFKDTKLRDVYKAIFTPLQLEQIDKMIKAFHPTELHEKAFGGAGGIGSGMVLSNIFGGELGKYIDKALHYYIGATILNLPFLPDYLGNNVLTPQLQNAVLSNVIYSEPFFELVAKDFGKAQAEKLIENTKANLDDYANKQGNEGVITGPVDSTFESIRDYLNRK